MPSSAQAEARARIAEAEAAVRQTLHADGGRLSPSRLLVLLAEQGVAPWEGRSAFLRLLERGELVWGRDRRLRFVIPEEQRHAE